MTNQMKDQMKPDKPDERGGPMTDQMKALLKTWLYGILQKSMILITKLLILLKVSTFCIPFDEF